MRIKNKELRQRRHRKEQVIKAAQREIRAQYAGKSGGEKPAPKPSKPVAKKSESAEKPKKAAPAKKKEEPVAAPEASEPAEG